MVDKTYAEKKEFVKKVLILTNERKFIMTNAFNLNVNLEKVSKAVKQFVADVAKHEGSKKKIDSDKEFNELGLYLSGNAQSMNKDEIGYIQGFMFEYQNKKLKEFEDEQVTDNTKKEVSKIAKRMGNKKRIDTDEEAQALALMLKNTHKDLNQADIFYIQNLLMTSGYANYLQPEEKSVTIINVQVNNKNAEADVQTTEKESVNNNANSATQVTSKPRLIRGRNANNVGKVTKEANRAKVEADRAEKEADRSKAEADRATKEADRSKAEADRAAKEADRSKAEANRAENAANSIKNTPKVSEKARTQGFGIATKIEEELHDFITNNDTVQKALDRVNSQNAYSFVGKMMEVTDKHNVYGSIYKRVSSSSVCHSVLCLLNQAKSIGLENDSTYTTLQETYKFIKRLYADKAPNDSIYDERDVQELDIQVKRLYNKMSQIYK